MTGQHPTSAAVPQAPPIPPTLRADARRNLEKLKAAARELFEVGGLDTPLEDIAQRAGVSTGTLYNRFGTREALLDAVVPDLLADRVADAVRRASASAGPWERFACYVEQICELEAACPALNDMISRRYPEAHQITAVCDEALEHARRFIEDAQRHGALRADFTPQDLFIVFLANGNLIRVTAARAPDAWRRNLTFTLDGLRAVSR
jgi:AcrR family transcriptional regulator